MRFFLTYLTSVSKPTLLIGAGMMLAYAMPAYAQQEDILLPAEDASVIEDTPPPTLPAPDPAALTAPVDPAAAEQAQDSIDDLLKKIDAGADEVKQAPPAVPEIEAEQSIATPPADAALASPDTVAAQIPADAGVPATGAVPEATSIPEIPALPAATQADENLFFDADNLVPEGEMGTKGGPRKVNPSLQPASKLIVVTKDYTPNARQAQLVSAERAITLGRYDAALELYNGMYEKNKRDPNILMGRAIALQHLGQTDEAIQAYEELLDIRPENIQAQVNMLGLMGQRYPAVGLQRLMDLRKKEPRNVALVGQIAVLQGGLGNYEEALKYLGIAASMEPHNANHLFNMAVIADRLGKKADAINYYEQALEIDTIYGGGRSIPRDSVYERLSRLR